MSVDWTTVRDFINTLNLTGPYPFPGTPEWIDSPTEVRISGLIIAGSRCALYADADDARARTHALKEAAIEIADARDWAAVAKHVRDRDDWHRDNPDLRRKVS